MRTVPDFPDVRANLAFTCAHEANRLPPLAPDAEQLFRYGRYLQLRRGPKNYDEVARLYRIAAAHGHYKANTNLQLLISQGLAWSPFRTRESVDLASQLIDAGVPSGYYDIGFYLTRGFGLRQDREMALRYFRKAADLGNPAAQFYVGELLFPWQRAPEIAEQMLRCAADQGHAKAAHTLATIAGVREQFADALRAYQQAVQAGRAGSAFFLMASFEGPVVGDLNYLALPADPERARRYKLIREFLNRYEAYHPKVPDIDQIVPLPPAPLPEWDGTFQWKRERDAAGDPPEPAAELIQRLSRAKQRDPATGFPLDWVPNPEPVDTPLPPLGTRVQSGGRCPQNGIWHARDAFGFSLDQTRRHFKAGEEMPWLIGHNPRRFDWLDQWLGMRHVTCVVTWELMAYADQPA